MSRSVSYSWELQRAARREAYLARIQGNTRRFYEKYQQLLNDLVNQGLEQYLPKEFANVRKNLAQLAYLINNNPEAARELSMAIGPEISSLPANARSVRQEFFSAQKLQEKEEAILQQKSNNELSQHLNSLFSQITDPVEQDFAIDEIKKLKSETADTKVTPGQLDQYKDQINQKFALIMNSAKMSADIWKKKRAQKNSKESKNNLIDIHLEQAKSDKSCNPKILASFIEQLENLKQNFDASEIIENTIDKASESLDEKVTDENCRKMVVKAILDSLEKANFVVNRPQRVLSDNDEVVILARKPAGAQALFKVAIDGSMIYKFDQYEGKRCKNDIDKVLPLLEEIYGVKLTDERILWENPERISKSEKPLNSDQEVKRK